MGSRNQPNGGDNTVVSSIRSKLDTVPQLTPDCCIYRVPVTLRSVNEEAYTPRLVSIGPFHHKTHRLQPMEVHKLRYLKEFLGKNPEKNMEYYVENLRKLEEKARKCYGEYINLKSDEFVEMMLIDGSFIIKFVLKFSGIERYNKRDPMFSTRWMHDTVLIDLLLTENQLPFFMIDRLFNLFKTTHHPYIRSSFYRLMLDCFARKNIIKKGQDDIITNELQHFVHLLEKCFVPSYQRMLPNNEKSFQFIPNATELHEAGVKFERCKSICSLDISFTKNGVFKIPPLHIENCTEILFRNLIAFEHCMKGTSYISDYALLIDNLINTPSDVALLRSCEIINSWLGHDEEVSALFNKLRTEVYTNPCTFYYGRLYEEVNAYYKTPWHRLLAKLKRDYFTTPWSTMSIIAAFILLVCTLIQTVCSVISTVKEFPPSPR